jgi:hypothetical protein
MYKHTGRLTSRPVFHFLTKSTIITLRSRVLSAEGARTMDRTSRSILIGLISVVGFAVIALIVSALVPFSVDYDATITTLTGSAAISAPNQDPQSVNTTRTNDLTLKLGDTLHLEPNSSATITLDLNGGRVTLSGPATFTLTESHRTGTSIDHLRKNGDLTLTLEQHKGSATYNFAHADPPFDAAEITLWLNDSDAITLDAPCWVINFAPDGTYLSGAAPCP